jgi:hypothetical protein
MPQENLMNSDGAHAALMDAIARLMARAGVALSSGVLERSLSEWERKEGRAIPTPVRVRGGYENDELRNQNDESMAKIRRTKV